MSKFEETVRPFADWFSYLKRLPIGGKHGLEEAVERADQKRRREENEEVVPLLRSVMENGANPEFTMAEHARLFDYLDPADYGLLIRRDRRLIEALRISAKNWLAKNGYEHVKNTPLGHFHILSPYYQSMFVVADLDVKISILLYMERHLSSEALNLLLEEEEPRAVIVAMARLGDPRNRLHVLFPDAHKCVLTLYENYEQKVISKIHIFIISKTIFPKALKHFKREFKNLGELFEVEFDEETEDSRDLAGGETDDESFENKDVLRILSKDGDAGAVTLKITPLEQTRMFLEESVMALTSNRPKDEIYSDIVKFHMLGPKISLHDEMDTAIRNGSIEFEDFCSDAFSIYVQGKGMTGDVIFENQESLERLDLALIFPSSDDIVEYE